MSGHDFTPRKDPHTSKTVLWGLLQPILLSIPVTRDAIVANPELAGVINGVIVIALRYLTKTAIK